MLYVPDLFYYHIMPQNDHFILLPLASAVGLCYAKTRPKAEPLDILHYQDLTRQTRSHHTPTHPITEEKPQKQRINVIICKPSDTF